MGQITRPRISAESNKKSAEASQAKASHPAAESDHTQSLANAQAAPLSASPQDILDLQSRFGQRAVQRLIQRVQE